MGGVIGLCVESVYRAIWSQLKKVILYCTNSQSQCNMQSSYVNNGLHPDIIHSSLWIYCIIFYFLQRAVYTFQKPQRPPPPSFGGRNKPQPSEVGPPKPARVLPPKTYTNGASKPPKFSPVHDIRHNVGRTESPVNRPRHVKSPALHSKPSPPVLPAKHARPVPPQKVTSASNSNASSAPPTSVNRMKMLFEGH